jgi:hypothetical protein
MSEQTTRPGNDGNRLVAVFADEHAANSARRSLVDAGVSEHHIAVGDPDDHAASLRGEMRSELGQSLAGPVSAPAARGFVTIAAIGVAVALIVAVPFAFIDAGGAYWQRFIVIAAIIAFLGCVIALVLGPGLGANRPDVPMAAERGVTLQVQPSSAVARGALDALPTIRIDEVDDAGTPIGTVDAGRGEGDGATAGGVVDNLRTDDYASPEPT